MEAIIVSHNSVSDLRGLIACDALIAAFQRVVLVDNASADDSAAIGERAGFTVIRQTSNDGYAAAVNAGFTSTKSPLVALLNPDIRFSDSDVISRLAQHFDSPTVAVAAPRLTLPNGQRQDSARKVPTFSDIVLRRLLNRSKGALWPMTVTPVPWIVGACLVIRRTAFEAVGGFDTRFPLYFEDVDLCVRLRAHNWQIILDPGVEALHNHNAASRQSLTGAATRRHMRSALKFYRAHPRYFLFH